MPTIAEHIKYLQDNYKPEERICRVFWHEDDIKATANDMSIILDDDDIEQVLDTLASSHDAEYGISWETIRCTIEHIKGTS